jgi:hypothetical protein|tara:strand:+ start:750 stop:1166 length:417 start_codon:yes stop_codon:yes gene_type:complete
MSTVETSPEITTHNGTLTVSNPATGKHRTFRIKTQKDDARFAPGERVISLLVGPDNTSDYRGFGFVVDGRVKVWRRFETVEGGQFTRYSRMLNSLEAECEKFGLVVDFATNCRRCNRQLTTPESVQSGIGPVCAKVEN